MLPWWLKLSAGRAGTVGDPPAPFLHVAGFPPSNSSLQKVTSPHPLPTASPPSSMVLPKIIPCHYLDYTMNQLFILLLEILQGAIQTRSPIASRQVSWVHLLPGCAQCGGVHQSPGNLPLETLTKHLLGPRWNVCYWWHNNKSRSLYAPMRKAGSIKHLFSIHAWKKK